MTGDTHATKEFNRELPVVVCVYIILTIMVSGLFVFDRGIFHDDIMGFSAISAYEGHPLKQLFSSHIASPTRIFSVTLYAIASWFRNPILFLNILFGVIWFFTGLCSYFLMKEIFPSHREIAFYSGALTLTATGDATINTFYPLYFSVLCYFASLVFLLKWWKFGARKWIIASGILLSFSIWTYDAAFAAILITPILFWVIDGFHLSRRLKTLIVYWYAFITPYLIVFTSFLFSPASYAATALVPMTFIARISRTMKLFINNFTPWRWALEGRHWFQAPSHLLPISFRLIVSLIAVMLFFTVSLWLIKKKNIDIISPIEQNKRFINLSIVCLLMALGSNAIYASVQFSEFYFRTQMVSRVWSSMAIAIAGYMITRTSFKKVGISLLSLSLFVGFGVYGGLESQDYLLGYWRQHRAELQSIVEQVPGLKRDAEVLLYIEPGKPFIATEAEYLAKSWLTVLYDDPSLYNRIFLWSEYRGSKCVNKLNGFVCQGEDKRESEIQYDKSILLIYSPSQNRYILQKTIPDYLLRNADVRPHGYNPDAFIVNNKHTEKFQSILYNSGPFECIFKSDEIFLVNDKDLLMRYDPHKINKNLFVGSIDLIKMEKAQEQPGTIRLLHAAGWAYDPNIKKPVRYVYVIDNGKPLFVLQVEYDRHDVSETLNNKDLIKTGWDLNVHSSQLSKGKHRLEFYALLSDGRFALLQNNTKEPSVEFNVL